MVQPADLKSPAGKIDDSMFPGEATATLDVRLQTYITEGVAEVGSELAGAELDAAVTLWAYYRAFEAVHLRMISTPASVNIAEEGSASFTGAQITSFLTMATEFRERFFAMLEPDAAVAQSIPSGGVSNRFSF